MNAISEHNMFVASVAESSIRQDEQKKNSKGHANLKRLKQRRQPRQRSSKTKHDEALPRLNEIMATFRLGMKDNFDFQKLGCQTRVDVI